VKEFSRVGDLATGILHPSYRRQWFFFLIWIALRY